MQEVITLKVEQVSNYSGTWWSVDKKCPLCNLLVFIPHGKDKDNCISIVNDKFEEMHSNCEASSAD